MWDPSAFLLPSNSVQTHRTFVLLPSAAAAAADSISQLAPRRARQFWPNERAIRSASLASRPKSSINLLLAGELGRGCRKLGQLNSPNECSRRTTSGLEAAGSRLLESVSQSVTQVSSARIEDSQERERERRHEHLSTSGIPFERRGRERESGGLMTPHHWPISRDTECLMARRRPPSPSSFASWPRSSERTLHTPQMVGRSVRWMDGGEIPSPRSICKQGDSSFLPPPMIISMVWQFGPPPPQTH